MRSLAVKLIVMINIVLVLVFLLLIVFVDHTLQKHYFHQKKSELVDFVQVVQESSLPIESSHYKDVHGGEAILFEIHHTGNENEFNAEIRENLVNRRIQFSKLWFPHDKIMQAQKGQNLGYFARQPLLKTHLLVRIFQTENQRMVFAGFSLANIEETLSTIKSYLFYLALMSMIFASALMSLISYWISKPISLIAEKTRRMAMLDFSGDLRINTRDELNELGGNVNFLANKLQRSLFELKRANEKMEESLEQRVQVDLFRKEFIANVSHELKTPLALISAYSQGLLDNIEHEGRRIDFCSIIIDEVQKMSSLVQELLELAELESGRVHLEISFEKIKDVISKIASKFELDFREKDILFEENIDNVKVYMDKTKIEKVVINIISNAVSFVDIGGAIRVSSEIRGDLMCVKVSNSGSNIAEENMENIWRPFARENPSGNKKYGGSGLGLAITKNILKLHESEFGVKNIEDGVEFHFSLSLSG